ncbi:MAG: response regulator [Nitrospirae bacterium]|nr:response regulator [Nitrospirota bacterium]
MYKILIAEDDDMNKLLLRDILTYHGYSVIEASDGEECLKLAKSIKPDLIFMDIQMPKIDGMTVLRMLKDDSLTKDVIIIAATAFAMKGDRERMLSAGFDDYISKPIDTKQIPVLIRKYLGANQE